MLTRELNLSLNSSLAEVEIGNFLKDQRSHTGFSCTREVVTSLRTIFLQNPSADEVLKKTLLSNIIRAFYHKDLPKNWSEWRYRDGLMWLEQKIIKISQITQNSGTGMGREEILESFRFCGAVSDASLAYSKDNKPTKKY